MSSRFLKTLLVGLAIGLGATTPVAAHDPGLSKVRIQVLDDAIIATTSLSQSDVESMLSTDILDGRATPTEEIDASELPESIVVRAIALESEGVAVAPRKVLVVSGESDSVEIELSFERPRRGALRADFPMLRDLPRGHRHHVTLLDASGVVTNQLVVASNAAPLVVTTHAPGWASILGDYWVEGVWHIWIGLDHILFLLTLLLPAVLIYEHSRWHSVDKLRPAFLNVLTIVTAFTAAHTATLALAVLGIVRPPSQLVEAVIALSVLVAAANNLRPVFLGSRWLMAFTFGLLHGFGFAGVLLELGLPKEAVAVSLIGFSIGVEMGQMLIVLIVFPVAFLVRDTSAYRRWALRGGSAVAVTIASIWIVERILEVQLIGI